MRTPVTDPGVVSRVPDITTVDAPLQMARVGPDPETVVLYAVVVAVVSLGLGFGVGVYRARHQGAGDQSASGPERTGSGSRESASTPEPGRDAQSQAGDLSGRSPSVSGGREETESVAGSTNRPPDTTPRAPDVRVDYDALTDQEPVGGGGNADVTRATLPTPEGNVTLAIKRPRMQGTLHADAVGRMLEEAETWDKLDDHDHVVGVVDYGAEPLPWIAMEYMDAGHLGERAGALGFDQALWTAIGITKGVRHAHRRGVAHLDLKPENVLFRDVAGAWDVPKVADWGLSKHLLEHSQSVEGLSPGYAAPEQFDRSYGATDDITDIYQLGAVYYELFTGRPPFEGESTHVMRAVLDETPTPPSEVADVPPELDDVLLTALAKDKADRYGDIVYLRDDLQALFEGHRA